MQQLETALEAFKKAHDPLQYKGMQTFLTHLLDERPELQGKRMYFPTQGMNSYTVIVENGDSREVFKAVQINLPEVREGFMQEVENLQILEGSGLPVPSVTYVGERYPMFGMTMVEGDQLSEDFYKTMTPEQQQRLAKDVAEFSVGLSKAFPKKEGEIAVNADLDVGCIMIDPQTQRFVGMVDFSMVWYQDEVTYTPEIPGSEYVNFNQLLEQEYNSAKGTPSSSADQIVEKFGI